MSVQSTLNRSWLTTRLRPILRFGTAGLLLGPGASKFLTYEQSVRFFREIAIPSPELLVLVVGALEILAAGLLIADRAVWVGALVALPIMVVAAITAGPTWQNIGVLGAAFLLLVFETRGEEVQTET